MKGVAMQYSPLADRLAGEGAAAWDIHFRAVAAQARGEDVIVLSVGDPDLCTPTAVIESAVAALRAGQTHYSAIIGEAPLRAAIAAHFQSHGGWPAGPDNVCVVAGAQNGLFCASMLLFQPGDQVLVLDPCYVTYEATLRAGGAEPVRVPPRPGGGFRPNPEAVRAAITPRTRGLMFATPNNPTGVVLSADELAALAEIAREADVWVVSDEVYASLCFEAEHRCIAALPGMAERTVTVSSLSKSHAMTGWRLGWMIGPPGLIAHAANLALCVLYGLPPFIQTAGVTALAEADAIAADMRTVFRRRRDRLLGDLDGIPGLRVLPPEAGMFVMADVSDTGLSSAAFARSLYQEQGVAVLDASAFGASAAGHIRLSYVLAEDHLSEAARRLAAFCRTRAGGLAQGGRHG